MTQETFNVILGVMLAALLAAVGYAVRRQITGADENRQTIAKMGADFATQMGKVAVTLAELNTGASAGARAAIADLRAELRASVHDLGKDLERLGHDLGQDLERVDREQKELRERHGMTNSTTVQLAERVNTIREDMRELRSYHMRRRADDPKPDGPTG